MSTVGGTPDKQYETLLGGLEKGHRVGYDATNKTFVNITGKKAQAGVNTDLYTVTTKIEEFIEAHKSTLGQGKIADLKKALENRASSLEGRAKGFFSIFISKEGKTVIKESAQRLRNTGTKIQKLTSQSLATQEKTSPTSEQLRAGESRSPSSKKIAEPPRQQTSSVEDEIFAGVPPPPPPPGTEEAFGAPPPPPPPGMGGKPAAPKKTFTHQQLTKPRALFEGEPTIPKIDPKHDLGKPNSMNENERKKYADAIDAYLHGTPHEVTKSKGRTTEVKVERDPNGLDHALQKVGEQIKKYDELMESLEGNKAKLKDSETQVKNLDAKIQELKTKNASNASVTLYTLSKNEIGDPIVFVSEAEYKEFSQQMSMLTPEERKKLEDYLGAIPQHNTIPSQIKKFENLKSSLQKEITSYKKDIAGQEKDKSDLEALKSNTIPFAEWRSLYDEKKAVKDSWEATRKTLLKGEVQEKPVTQKESEIQELLNKVPAAAQFVAVKQGLKSAMEAGLRKDPENIYNKLVDHQKK